MSALSRLLVLSEASWLQLHTPDLLSQTVEERLFSRLERSAGESKLPADGIQQVRCCRVDCLLCILIQEVNTSWDEIIFLTVLWQRHIFPVRPASESLWRWILKGEVWLLPAGVHTAATCAQVCQLLQSELLILLTKTASIWTWFRLNCLLYIFPVAVPVRATVWWHYIVLVCCHSS